MTAPIGLLRQPRTLLLGRGMRRALVTCLPPTAKQALVVTDERMADQAAFAELVALLDAGGLESRVIASVQPECPADDVASAARSVDDESTDVIVAIGGGSVIDFAKLLGVLVAHGGHPHDYYGEFAVPGPAIPVVAVPTTAGTGSEATPVAVVSDAERTLKVGVSSPHLIPLAAICDPELTDSAPASLTAASGVDALSHCIEAYTAIVREPRPALVGERVFVGKGTLVDMYALAGIGAVGRSLGTAIEGGASALATRDARDGMAFAALAGGIALGTAGTAAAHALQYPVGALTHTPHGVGIAVLLPYVMAYNRPARVEEYARIALALGVDEDGDPVALSHRAIDAVAELVDAAGLPRSLADIGVGAGDLQWIAEQSFTARRLVDNNPRPLTVKALARIAAAAHAGDRGGLALEA